VAESAQPEVGPSALWGFNSVSTQLTRLTGSRTAVSGAETGVPVCLPRGVHGEVAAQIANALRNAVPSALAAVTDGDGGVLAAAQGVLAWS
jgi:hypothetical protein